MGAGATPGISVRLHTEAVGGQDTGRLERLPLRDNRSDGTRAVSAAALFVLVGASPRTDQALSIARFGLPLRRPQSWVAFNRARSSNW